MTEVQIIQITRGGVPDDPEVYANTAQADERWLELYDDGFNRDVDVIPREKAENYGLLTDESEDNEIRYYSDVRIREATP